MSWKASSPRQAQTPFAERFVLKGGMLLAALGERRPTRDIDLQASTTGSDAGTVLTAVRGNVFIKALPSTVSVLLRGN
jgi:nucleotidyltransferase AbiEii toxin of type IV toxin-antitoxin system